MRVAEGSAIRTEQTADRAAVRDLHLAAFGDHGSVVADLVDALRQLVTAEVGLSLVAEVDGVVAGHVMFTPSLLDAPRELVTVAVLSPLAVTPDHQRQGIGSALVACGLDLMSTRGVPAVFLEGSPAYYRRLGFRPGADHGFRKPSLRIPDAAFQAVLLPSYEAWMTGTLVYAETFWRLDAVGLRAA